MLCCLSALIAGGSAFVWYLARPADSTLARDAVKADDIDTLTTYLDQHSIDVNYRYEPGHSNGGRTLLHEAAEGCNPDIVLLLLQFGADPNTKDNLGQTPLYGLIGQGFSRNGMKCLTMLLEWGSDITTKDHQLATPLVKAIRCSVPEYVSRLLKAGAPLNQIATTNDWTPLHCACANSDSFPGAIECVTILLSAGANPRIKDPHGRTALDVAIMNENTKIVDLLRKWKVAEE